jgi:hypothetical protein
VLRFPNVSLKDKQSVTFDAGSKAAVVAEK